MIGRVSQMRNIRLNIIFGVMVAAGMGISAAGQAAGPNPVTQQAQSQLTALGFDPGPSDGILGRHTIAAIKAFQEKSGLPVTGILDSATLAKLDTGAQASQAPQTNQAPQVSTVSDWRPAPAQDELDKLVANPVNDPSFAY